MNRMGDQGVGWVVMRWMIPLTPDPPRSHAAGTSQPLHFLAFGMDLTVSRQSPMAAVPASPIKVQKPKL